MKMLHLPLPNIESTTEIFASSQATNDPICAIKTAVPTDLKKVLFPPMLGPVMIWKVPCSDHIKKGI